MQRRFRDWFRENGIADERVKFEGPGGPLDFLASINEIDIALDPFPYTGGTTTLETLWMGRSRGFGGGTYINLLDLGLIDFGMVRES